MYLTAVTLVMGIYSYFLSMYQKLMGALSIKVMAGRAINADVDKGKYSMVSEILSVVFEGINGKYAVFAGSDGTRMMFADGGLNSDGEGAVKVATSDLLPDFNIIPKGSQAEIDFYHNYAKTQLGL